MITFRLAIGISILLITLSSPLACRCLAAENSFKLDLPNGLPVLTDLSLNGVSVAALLDSGDSGLIAVAPDLYKKLHVQAKTGGHRLVTPGDVNTDQSEGMISFSPIGSSRTAWLPVLSVPAFKRESFSAILPFNALDGDCISFLLSRSELLLTNIAPPAADGTPVQLDDDDAVKRIPYWETSSGIFVFLSCDGTTSLAQVDTGAVLTSFSANYALQHAQRFRETGRKGKEGGLRGVEGTREFQLESGVAIVGETSRDDLVLPIGNYDASQGKTFENKPVGKEEPGNPVNLPYFRMDYPRMAPVAVIGMSTLGKFDFQIDRRSKMLYLWEPQQTPRLFPPERHSN